jgi:gliding motility-associated protein GldM
MKNLKIVIVLFTILFNFQLHSQTENLAVVSSDKMNVFYTGIDNPVTIALQGITSDKIKVSINNGTITGSNGKYIVKVDTGSEAIIKVTAETKPGETKKAGSGIFKVKRIPDPAACIGNYCKSNLFISKEELVKNTEVSVSSDLPFELKFEVISFTVTFKVKTATQDYDLLEMNVTGNKFNQNAIDRINKMENGGNLYIENIKAKTPDGTVRTLSSIDITITEKK